MRSTTSAIACLPAICSPSPLMLVRRGDSCFMEGSCSPLAASSPDFFRPPALATFSAGVRTVPGGSDANEPSWSANSGLGSVQDDSGVCVPQAERIAPCSRSLDCSGT